MIGGTDGIIYFHSVDSKISFEWILTIHDRVKKIRASSTSLTLDPTTLPAAPPPPVSIVLIGIECEGVRREVSFEEGHKLTQDLGCVLFQASVKTKANVNEALYDIIRKCRNTKEVQVGDVRASKWKLTTCFG